MGPGAERSGAGRAGRPGRRPDRSAHRGRAARAPAGARGATAVATGTAITTRIGDAATAATGAGTATATAATAGAAAAGLVRGLRRPRRCRDRLGRRPRRCRDQHPRRGGRWHRPGLRLARPGPGRPHRILLVARTHAAGLGAASRRLDALRKGEAPAGLELLAVVLVADAPGRLPLKLARRIRVLRSAVRTQTFPWVPSWRLGEQPARPPRELSVLADLAGQPHRSARGMR